MISIIILSKEIDIISRRIYIKHKNGLFRREITEIITLYNSGSDKIHEIGIELEEFRDKLNIFDENNNRLTFLTKKRFLEKLPSHLSEKIKSNEIFILWVLLPINKFLPPKRYKTIKLIYIDFESHKKGNASFIYQRPYLYFNLKFYKEETTNIYLLFENGIKNDYGLLMTPFDVNNKIVNYPTIASDFHYKIEEHYLSMGISSEKREEHKINSLEIFYTIGPETDVKNTIDILAIFSIVFPFIGLYWCVA